jgi:hypothetical protein
MVPYELSLVVKVRQMLLRWSRRCPRLATVVARKQLATVKARDQPQARVVE